MVGTDMSNVYDIVFEFGETRDMRELLVDHKHDLLSQIDEEECDEDGIVVDHGWSGNASHDINVYSNSGSIRFDVYPVVNGSVDTSEVLASGRLVSVDMKNEGEN